MSDNLNCKSTQKRLATLWGFVPGTPENIAAARAVQAEALQEVAQLVANVGEYREVVDTMALSLPPHERSAFIQLFREKAKAALAVGPAAGLALAPSMFQCEITPRPLSYPLADYHRAPGEGPLHATWRDKPHRIVYDLVAAVRYYAASATAGEEPSEGGALLALAADLRARADRTDAPGNELYVLGLREAADAAAKANGTRRANHVAGDDAAFTRATAAKQSPVPVRLTKPMREALQRLASGGCLRGHTHGTTILALKNKGLIEDTDTITDEGRAALAANAPGSVSVKDWAGVPSEDVLHCYWIMMSECASQADSNNDHVLRLQVEAFYRQWNKLNGTDLEPIWVTRAKQQQKAN